MRLTFCLLVLVCTLSACGPEYLYENKVELPDENWTYADSLQFDFSIADTNRIYNLYLDVEHATTFATQNLYTRIRTQFPEGQSRRDVLSLELADKAGVWQGDCNADYCTLRIPLQAGAYFKQTGAYRIVIEQFMRKPSVKGVKSMALRIEKREETR